MHAKIQAAGRTDIGRRRDKNQDQFLIADLSKSMMIQSTSLNIEAKSRLYGAPQGRLFVVADGMGGHQAGNRASVMAVDILINRLLNNLHWFYRLDQDNENDFIESFKSLIRSTHEIIESESKAKMEFRGMGTTLTVAYVAWPKLFVIHVGDTRCYLMRDGELRQITRDHTMANQMAEQGNLSKKELEQSPWSNVLWNALGGGGKEVAPEVTNWTLEPGDAIMMCSDGLNKHVSDEEIRNILELEQDPNAACRSLIELANYRGGSDNITSLVARFGPPDLSPNRTLVSAQVTLERMLDDLDGFNQRDSITYSTIRPTDDVGEKDTDPGIPTQDIGTTVDFPESPK